MLGPVVWIGSGWVSESTGWGESPIIHINGDSAMVPACASRLCWGMAQQRNNGVCPSCPWPAARQVSFFWYVPRTFQSAIPSLEFKPSIYDQVNLLGLTKRMPRSTTAMCLTLTESLLIFTGRCCRCCGDSSFCHWCSGLGWRAWCGVGWEPLLLSGDLHSWDTTPDS